MEIDGLQMEIDLFPIARFPPRHHLTVLRERQQGKSDRFRCVPPSNGQKGFKYNAIGSDNLLRFIFDLTVTRCCRVTSLSLSKTLEDDDIHHEQVPHYTIENQTADRLLMGKPKKRI